MACTQRHIPSEIYRKVFAEGVPTIIRHMRHVAVAVIQREYRRWRRAWHVPICTAQSHYGAAEHTRVRVGDTVKVSAVTFTVGRIEHDWQTDDMKGSWFTLFDTDEEFRKSSATLVLSITAPAHRVTPCVTRCKCCDSFYQESQMKSHFVCLNCWYYRALHGKEQLVLSWLPAGI
jgi:hypothetical protein